MKTGANGGTYFILVADIRKSSIRAEQENLLRVLKSALDELNVQYADEFLIPFSITLGDLFQCVFKRGEKVMNIITCVQRRMHPVSVRFGIGYGEITPAHIVGIEGAGYSAAINALAQISEKEKRKQETASQAAISICRENCEEQEMLLNTILMMMTTIKSTWNRKQFQIISDMLNYQESQTNAAHRLGLTQSSVQKNLATSMFYTYKEAMDTVQKTLINIHGD